MKYGRYKGEQKYLIYKDAFVLFLNTNPNKEGSPHVKRQTRLFFYLPENVRMNILLGIYHKGEFYEFDSQDSKRVL